MIRHKNTIKKPLALLFCAIALSNCFSNTPDSVSHTHWSDVNTNSASNSSGAAAFAVSSFTPSTSTTNSIPLSVVVTFNQAKTNLTTANITVTGTCTSLPTVSSVSNDSSTTATLTLSCGICTSTQTAIIGLTGVTDSNGISLSGTSSVTFTQSSVSQVYIYKSLGTTAAMGSRSTTTSTCQTLQATTYSGLSCSHYVALLGYAGDNGVQNLPSSYSVPTAIPFLSSGGNTVKNNWCNLINDTDPGNSLSSASVLANGDYAWTGFTTGGALSASTCAISGADWTDADAGHANSNAGNRVHPGGSDLWNGGATAACWSSVPRILCLCW